jgi:nucleotide-binding universal stress UspA family protein
MVVGVDYSDLSERAVAEALELASLRENAEVHLIHVLPIAAPDLYYDAAIPPGTYSFDDAFLRLRHYSAVRAQSQTEYPSQPIRVVPHLEAGAAPDHIVRLAIDLDADLIVVGTHGSKGIERLLLGSVAEKVVRYAPCPVLVVRPKAANAKVMARLRDDDEETAPATEPTGAANWAFQGNSR